MNPEIKLREHQKNAVAHILYGGNTLVVYPYEEPVAIICDEEAKLKGSELNRVLRDEDGKIYDVVAGTFLIVGLGEEDFASLTPEHMMKMQSELSSKDKKFILRKNIELYGTQIEHKASSTFKPSSPPVRVKAIAVGLRLRT